MSEGSVLLTGDKFTRRKILDDLYRKVQSSPIEVEVSNQISEIIQVAANDSVSTFREKAARILLEIFSNFNPTTEQLSEVYHLISLRIKDEPVEETRLAFAQLFNSCIKRSVETVDLDPIANTVKIALYDPFHEVISCMCLAILELSKRSGFNFMADYFVQPLLEGLKRKQVSVRIDCARALHPVLSSSTLLIPDAAPRLFRFFSEDENPKLQLAIVTSVGSTAIEITPTDHNFHHLLPILLVGMCSEFEPVREQSEKLWGNLINEHGRIFLKKSSHQLITFCRNGSEDWTSPVRISSAQLLYAVVKELGQEVAEELNDILELIVHQSGDGEASIVATALKTSELLGKSSAKETVDWLTSLNEPFDVQILAGIVKGSQGSGLDIESCLNLLERFEHSSKNTQFLLDCAEVLLKLDANVEQLDRLLIVLLSVGGESGHSARSISLLEIATARMNHKNVPELMQTRLQSLWNLLPADEIASGDTSSRPWNILNFVIHRLEKVDAVAVKIILRYLLSNSSPEITLKSLNLLTASMPKLDDCSLDDIGIVSEVRKQMKWKVGRTSAAIRSAAVLCMWSMLQHQKYHIPATNLDEFVKLVLHLVEDEVILTRLTTARILKLTFRKTENVDRKMDDVFTTLAGRADDISREVRREALLALEDIFITSGKFGVHYREKFNKLLDTLCLDEDQSTRQTAEGILKSMEKCQI